MRNVADVEKAERLGRSRSRVFFMMALVFLLQQSVYFSAPSARDKSQFRIGAWLILVALMLLLIGTGGFLLKGWKVLDLLNDEASRHNRLKSQAFGFWGAMAAAITIYLTAIYQPVDLKLAHHVIVTGGIGVALLSFAALERRAYRLG
jgi:hypothetical protein